MTQAQGRPDLVAKITLFEVIPYLAVLWILISLFGLRGAAIAWTLRAAVDTLLQIKIAGLRLLELKRLAGGGLLLLAAVIIAEEINISIAMSLCLAILCTTLSVVQILRHPIMRSYVIEIVRKLPLID